MTWNDFIKSRATTWILIVVLVFVCVLAGRILIQKHQIDAEIKKLQDQADAIHKNNQQLAGLIQYFSTPEYQEKQAREQLNLKKNGEYVVVLPPNTSDDSANAATSGNESNFKLWFDYFFHSK